MLPQDPDMLASMINMKLRDLDVDLDELCEQLDIDREELETRLKAAGYSYMADRNCFK